MISPGLCALNFYPQRFDAAQDGLSFGRGRRKQTHRGKAFEQSGEGDAAFEHGQGCAEASTTASAKGYMALVLAVDVENVGIREDGGVSIGGADENDDALADGVGAVFAVGVEGGSW